FSAMICVAKIELFFTFFEK
ncbi:hypothetical protein A5875_001222, partial [Enterococcus sp. 3H8_DIV0648]